MDSVPLDQDDFSKDTSSFTVWNNFFILAGIPSAVAHEYAVTFAQHRIRIDMLKEINKEILLDMGIKAMGDIIAILRHAKNLYTRDELIGVQPKVTANVGSISTNNIRQTIVNRLAPRTAAPITTRLSSNVSPLVGNKIQSQVSLSSGALMASSNSLATSLSLSKNKRVSTSISDSLAKRLRPAPDSNNELKVLPEKTLTVRYPSKEAIAKAQQRIMINTAGTSTTQQPPNSSIRSRLGASISDSDSRSERSNNFSNNNNRKNWIKDQNLRNGTSGARSSSSGKRLGLDQASRADSGHRSSRIKSTVFKRLGHGAR